MGGDGSSGGIFIAYQYLDVPISSPAYWVSEDCTDEAIKNIFRSETEEEIPLLQARIDLLREAGHVLQEVRLRHLDLSQCFVHG